MFRIAFSRLFSPQPLQPIGCLAQSYAPVIGCDHVVAKNPEARFFQVFDTHAKKKGVLKNATAEVETADGIKVLTFKVVNTAQQKWIQDNRLRSLEGNLQKKVGSSKLRLEVGVIPMEKKEKQPYTDQEKATALMGKNGEIQNLIKDFGLETK